MLVSIGASNYQIRKTTTSDIKADKKGVVMNTLEIIHKISNERFQLWRRAGNVGLSAPEAHRVQEITGELAVLWDRYRRELAGDNRVRNSDYVKPNRAA
jgi:hypothetical protein